jgi:cell division protein FtsL
MPKIKKNLIIKLLFGLIILTVFAFLFFNENGIVKYLSLKSEINDLDTQIKEADKKILQLQKEIDSLKTSKEKIEKVARERYHMLLPSEQVLKVEEK